MKRLLGASATVALAAYCIAFVWCFEVFGSPVRDNTHGWLGPKIRGDAHVTDIGKVYYREGTDIRYYSFFFPLCKLWLFANGLR
jgi:hypothetical protein